ncbi:cyanase [Kocuria sp. U4B]
MSSAVMTPSWSGTSTDVSRVPAIRACAAHDVSTNPTIYRLHELEQVYGPACKALICANFRDGIMSAINCSIIFDTAEHPDGTHVVISIDGKFLPCAWTTARQ